MRRLEPIIVGLTGVSAVLVCILLGLFMVLRSGSEQGDENSRAAPIFGKTGQESDRKSGDQPARRDDMLKAYLPAIANKNNVPQLDLSKSAQDWVDQTFAELTLEAKIGQLIITGVPDTEMSEDTCLSLQAMRPAGVTFQWYNLISPEQMRAYTSDLRACLAEAGAPPPFFTLAHEGEYVQRFDELVTSFPAALAVGAAGDPQDGYRIGKASGQELAYSGLNMVLAPVADVLLDYDNEVVHQRTFGDSPGLVSEYVAGFVRGYLESGVMPVIKHFPGHGGVAEDSHKELPVDLSDLARLEQAYLPPFQAGLDSGDLVVMLSHVAYPAVSGDDLPATFSPVVLGLLRNQMEFRGVIMSDHMDMRAATSLFPVEQASIRAVEAGVDLLLLNEPDKAGQAYDRLLEASLVGELSSERVDWAVRRVLSVKAAMGLNQAADPLPEPDWEAHHELARQIAYRAVTLYRDQDQVIPIPPDLQRVLIVGTVDDEFSFYEESLKPALEQAGFEVEIAPYTLADKGQSGSDEELVDIGQQAEQADVIIVFTYQAYLRDLTQEDDWQKQLVERLESSEKPVIVVGLRSPTDLLEFPHIHNYLASFGTTAGQRQALVDILVHGKPAQGTNPLPGLK
jgi:beta-N-acetylhexosaminidase